MSRSRLRSRALRPLGVIAAVALFGLRVGALDVAEQIGASHFGWGEARAQDARAEIRAPDTAGSEPKLPAKGDAVTPDANRGVAQRAVAAPGSAATAATRLPADSRTSHTLAVAGRTLAFTAVAGSLPISNAQGRVLAEVAYIAYTLDGQDARSRPVTFAFNGGPGSASTWLQLGALGPWRVPLTAGAAQPSAVPTLTANPDSWIEFTDLVFIDPVGTGFSAIVPELNGTSGGQGGGQATAGRGGGSGNREEGGPRWFWSVNGDIESFADVIQLWLRRNDRMISPKMLVGESYGGFRAPRITQTLQRQRGIGINAMILVSPVIDFEGRRGGHSSTFYANLLPSIAAAALERRGVGPTREGLQTAEAYARGDYLTDLMRGPRDTPAVDRITAKVTELSGLAIDRVRRHGGRLSGGSYLREINEPDHRVASLYDASLTGFDPNPSAPGSSFDDPFTTGLSAPLTGAMLELYARLGWRVDRSYQMLSGETNRGWLWGNSPNAPESISALKQSLALDSRLRVLVTHGFTDLVTPYLASALLLDQLPAYGDPDRVALKVYPGGHMHYSRDASRAALRHDVQGVFEAAVTPATGAKTTNGTF